MTTVPPIAFHAYALNQKTIDGGSVGIPVSELMIWVLSIGLWKTYQTPLKFFGDRLALDVLGRAGLLELYQEVNQIDIPDQINQKIFWCAIKELAIQRIAKPVIAVDTDIWLWKPIRFDFHSSVQGLHTENPNWGSYQRALSSPTFNLLGIESPEKVVPINGSLLAFYDTDIREAFIESAIGYMSQCSDRIANGSYSSEEIRAFETSQMCLVEQWLPAAIAIRIGKTCSTFVEVDWERCIVANGHITHFWDSKKYYQVREDLRNRLCEFVIEQIRQRNLTRELGVLDRLEVLSPSNWMMEFNGHNLLPPRSTADRNSLYPTQRFNATFRVGRACRVTAYDRNRIPRLLNDGDSVYHLEHLLVQSTGLDENHSSLASAMEDSQPSAFIFDQKGNQIAQLDKPEFEAYQVCRVLSSVHGQFQVVPSAERFDL